MSLCEGISAGKGGILYDFDFEPEVPDWGAPCKRVPQSCGEMPRGRQTLAAAGGAGGANRAGLDGTAIR